MQFGLQSSSLKRYSPTVKDSVIGTICARAGEHYKLDIGAAHPALLSFLAFEGATKRNRPSLEVGDVVYARMVLSHRDMDPEVECVHPATGKADGYGHLKGGFLMTCSLETCRQLMDASHPGLVHLAKAFPFEIAIGLNGRIWIQAGNAKIVFLIKSCIESLQNVPVSLAEATVRRLLRAAGPIESFSSSNSILR